MGDLINWYEVLVGMPQEMRLLDRHKRRWDDNIEIEKQPGTPFLTTKGMIKFWKS
jgi:hypothetical protein